MALVRKILEATIPSGGSSATFTDSDIPNSLIRVYSTNSNIYPQNISLAGTTLTVTYEAVTSALGVAVELVKQGLEIDDNLTSDNTDHALSAKQGKVLKGLIDSIPAGITELSELDDVAITDIEDGQVLAWDETAEKFINVNQSAGSLCFIDTDNLITSGTLPVNTEVSYTAIQDCIIVASMACGANAIIYIKVNDVNVFSSYIPSNLPLLSLQQSVLVKAGQTVKMLSSYTGGPGDYSVYGLQ